MMTLLFLLLIVYIAWPYVAVYRLDRALAVNDRDELVKLIDVDAIRRQLRGRLDREIEGVAERYDNPIFRFLRGGAKELTSTTFEDIDYEWVREFVQETQRRSATQRRPVLGSFSFAFFESPRRFLIRVGEMGENPVHLRMTLQGWQWRVSALFA